MNRYPNLFIVGAAKAGTTSLFFQLQKHPDIYFSPLKEPNFFSTDISIDNFSKRYKKRTVFVDEKYFKKQPLTPLQLSFVRNREWYAKLFETDKDYTLKGEASTSYLFSTVAAENIFKFNSDSKIIIVLRHPVQRTYSHYLMALRYGFTSQNFRQAIEKDINSPVVGWGQSELFIELSLYFEQIKRYYAIFPRKQIKVILFENLIHKTETTFNDLWHFLGVTPLKVEKIIKENTSEQPKFTRFNKLLSDMGIKQIIGKFISNATKTKLKSLLFSTQKDEIKKSDREFLLNLFREDIAKTAEFLNIDLSHWLH